MKLLQIHEPGETPLPHSDSAAVGIDLGTTHSVVAIASEESAEVVHNIHGHALVPSVVYYGEHGEIEIGYPAKKRHDVSRNSQIFEAFSRKSAGQGSETGGDYRACLF